MKTKMRAAFLFIVVGLLFAAHASAGSHSVSFSWNASTTVGASYHVQRAPCSAAITAGLCPSASEGAFAIIATVTALTYTDATVVGNTNYSYAISAFCPTATACAPNFAVNQDSALSNHIGAAIPPDAVAPASGLAITNIALQHDPVNNTDTLTASWHDPAKRSTDWSAIDTNGKAIVSGSVTSSTGDYSVSKTWPAHTYNPLTFKVCDTTGCTSQVIFPN